MSDDIFADFLPVVDRSRLQSYATCPLQARLSEQRKGTVGEDAEIGEQVHRAFGRVVQCLLDDHNMHRSAIAETFERELQSSRPDLQPKVIDAAKASIWPLASYLAEINPLNVLHFDGGQGEKSGQLSCDIEALQFRLTRESDFVHATDSTEVLRVLDLKSGRKQWDYDAVLSEFAFAIDAYLLFQKYERVQVVQIAVWMTRFGHRTPFVDFSRRRMADIYGQILTAYDALARNERAPIEKVEAFPTEEKCRICSCAASCRLAEAEFATDPAILVDQLIASEARVKALEKRLSAVRDETGRDIVSPNGNAYGTEKPSSRKKTKSAYSVKGASDG